MTAGSLRLRMLVATALSIIAALLLIGVMLVWIFELHLRDRIRSDLQHQLNQLAALVVPDIQKGLRLDGEMTDPRYDRPLGGLYWQIDREGRPLARSRSLWDTTLRLGTADGDGTALLGVEGPGAASLLALVREVGLRSGSGTETEARYLLAVAIDGRELSESRGGLIRSLTAGLGAAFLGLLSASWFQVGYGLRPLKDVRREVERIRLGVTPTMATDAFPREILPLAQDINRLVISQQEGMERARRQAGDLAHGLKTPLAAIAAEADALRRSGATAHAEALSLSVAAMQRHVERQLALARSHGGRALIGATVTDVTARIAAVVDVLRRLPADRQLDWRIDGDAGIGVSVDPDDFDEIFGNLADNARKWAQRRIQIVVVVHAAGVEVRISDDGPGVAEQDLIRITGRGVRLDERVQGAGLGLSIVEAIMESYGAQLHLRSASIGGLEVTVLMPPEKALQT